MSKNIYAVMGASGNIGKVVTEELLKSGHFVMAITRDAKKLTDLQAKGAKVVICALDNAATLEKTFVGVAGVFALIPPAYSEDDYGAYQDRCGQATVTALKKARVPYVVNLSSIGAHLPEGTGPIKGLYRQEQRLNALTETNVLHLRPSYFMENQLHGIPIIKQHGVNSSPLNADAPIPMIATRDIGLKAAEILNKLNFKGKQVVELIGPKAITLNEVTAILGAAIGKPDLRYVQASYEDAKQAMLGSGMKPGLVDLMLEMNRAFNEGKVLPTQKLIRGRTTVEKFAEIYKSN